MGGNVKYETAVAFYSPDRPRGFDRFDFARSPWVTPQAIAAGGLLGVCEKHDACRAGTAKFATPQTTQTEITLAHDALFRRGEPVRFVVTIVPPRG